VVIIIIIIIIDRACRRVTI